MPKLSFLNALPPYVRQVALAEITQLLQAKHGQSFSISEQDFSDYEAGNTKQVQEPTDKEIDDLLNSIM